MRKRMKKTVAKDRISDISDSLKCHILSFLDMKEVLMASLISKRWRNLWRNVPSLNFDFSLGNSSSTIIRPEKEYMNFVYMVLLMYNESSSLQKIKFSFGYGWNVDFHGLNAWLKFAENNHVKEVHIESAYSKTQQLLDVLFSSDFEVLKLKDLQLPASAYSARNLRTLELDSVLLPYGDSEAPVITFGSNLPALETLIIKYHNGSRLEVLDISSPRLENLVLEHSGGEANRFTLKLQAPNLRSFQFTGCCSVMDYSLEDVASLVSVKIRSCKDLHSDCLFKILEGFYNLTALEISGESWKAFSGDGQYNQFPTLEHLKLFRLRTTTDSDSCIQTIANFLKSAPCVENVVLEICKKVLILKEDSEYRNRVLRKFGKKIKSLKKTSSPI